MLAAIRGLPIPEVENFEKQQEEDQEDQGEGKENGVPHNVSNSTASNDSTESVGITSKPIATPLKSRPIAPSAPSPQPHRRLSAIVLSSSPSTDHDDTSSKAGNSSAEDLNINTPTDQHSDHEESDLEALKAQSVHVEQVQNSPPKGTMPVPNRNRAHTTSIYGPGDASSSPPLEILLYRDAIECPICFLYYPKYINYTRCCSQPICSECFLQMKRSEPHPPSPSPSASTTDTSAAGLAPETTSTTINPASETTAATVTATTSSSSASASATAESSSSSPSTPTSASMNLQQQDSQASSSSAPELPLLVSDPACCPFCTEKDFGVYYIPGPYRSGIGRSIRVNTTPRRRVSLPPTAPEVVTTDRIRPDWAAKLSAARQHLARKSAAANALHASAFLGEGNSDRSSRSRKKERKKKTSRLRALHSSLSGSSTPTERSALSALSGSRSSRNRENNMEELMIVEAIRLSLYDQHGNPTNSAGSSKRANEITAEGGVRTVV